MLKRKILAGILSSVIFTLIFTIPFEMDYNVNSFFNLYYLNLIFILTYGLAISCLSDWVTGKVFKKRATQEIVSFLIHCLFAGVFLALSLTSASLFFIADRLLKKVNLRWWVVLTALAIVVVVFVSLIAFS